ncbi:MAG: glutamine--fructose-6-phosphate transaminase (isomerizing) [Oscillospiraceae bacterium]|nr:glutamine--fructose-6-phosphate transaminase (isomerizing) [Oscillospiraceae bacterium]
MCGIIGYVGGRNAVPVLLDGLQRLEYRGYDSAGLAVAGKEGIGVCRVTGRVAALREKTRDGTAMPGRTGIGHTRWATHGPPMLANAHPHRSGDGRFAVVHNGIIENYQELRQELTAAGCRFESETDTEVVAHLLGLAYRGDLPRAVREVTARLRGSYALGILCADEPGKLLAVRQASPLILGIGAGENFLASDPAAVAAFTREVIFLEDGEMAELTADSVRVFNRAGQPVAKKTDTVSWDIRAAEKGGCAHFMLKEILEQPLALKAALSPRLRDGEIMLDGLDLELSGIDRILITACGSAYYAGCAGRYAIEGLCRIPARVELASELRYGDPLIDGRTLLIVLSQSGETADTIAAVEVCHRRGAKVLAIVNVVGSTIARMADHVLYTWAGPEVAVATTKGYTTQLAVLYLFALYAGRSRGTIGEGAYRDYLAALEALPGQLEQALGMNPGIGRIVKEYARAESVFYIGRNTDYAAALEGALKLKEVSYIHAEAYAAGELKHGTIALIREGQPVVALCGGPAAEKTRGNILEVKARGARVLAVTEAEDEKTIQLADEVLLLPETLPLFRPAVQAVPLQLFAYHAARERGCDIDKPRNLAKSVTVE